MLSHSNVKQWHRPSLLLGTASEKQCKHSSLKQLAGVKHRNELGVCSLAVRGPGEGPGPRRRRCLRSRLRRRLAASLASCRNVSGTGRMDHIWSTQPSTRLLGLSRWSRRPSMRTTGSTVTVVVSAGAPFVMVCLRPSGIGSVAALSCCTVTDTQAGIDAQVSTTGSRLRRRVGSRPTWGDQKATPSLVRIWSTRHARRQGLSVAGPGLVTWCAGTTPTPTRAVRQLGSAARRRSETIAWCAWLPSRSFGRCWVDCQVFRGWL